MYIYLYLFYIFFSYFDSFDRLADAPVDENGQIHKKYDIIQPDGLAGVGERVDPGDVYINKQVPVNANDNTFTGQAATVAYKNAPSTYKSPVAGNIDKVMLTDTENDQILVKVLIRQTRRPELGDKFSSRQLILASAAVHLIKCASHHQCETWASV